MTESENYNYINDLSVRGSPERDTTAQPSERKDIVIHFNRNFYQQIHSVQVECTRSRKSLSADLAYCQAANFRPTIKRAPELFF